MDKPLERRRYIRVFVDSPISFATPKGALGVGEMINLSLRGLSFMTQEQIKVGSPIRVSFSLGREMTFELGGKVRHAIGKGSWKYYGVEFTISDYEALRQHMQLNEFIIEVRRRQDTLTASLFRKKSRRPPEA